MTTMYVSDEQMISLYEYNIFVYIIISKQD